jgi:hypothetical protein
MTPLWIPEPPRLSIEELLDRLEAMREMLLEEHGAELDYFRGEYGKELADYALDLGLALLECKRPQKRSAETFDFPPRGKM